MKTFLKYNIVSTSQSMFDALLDSKTWKEFFRIAYWWRFKSRSKPTSKYWAITIVRVLKEKIYGMAQRETKEISSFH